MKRIILVSMAVALVSAFWAINIANAQKFSEWSAQVNVGAPVNSSNVETCVAVSKDGLSLFFAAYRPDVLGLLDLYVAQRDSVDDPWGTPVNLGANVNSSANETCPALSLDEHRLYFVSNRDDEGNCGGRQYGFGDIYVSRRHDRQDDFGWEPAENLGCVEDGYVNSWGPELTPAFFEDENGKVMMYFGGCYPGRGPNFDICASVEKGNGKFGLPEVVEELSTLDYNESGATIRRAATDWKLSSLRTALAERALQIYGWPHGKAPKTHGRIRQTSKISTRSIPTAVE